MNMRQLIPNPVRRVIPNPIKQLPWRLKWARSTAAYADAPFAALTRLAEWTFLECIRDELEFDLCGGLHFSTMPNNFCGLMSFVAGEYEPHLLNFLNRHLCSGAIFCDVGANIGLYTAVASRLVGPSGRVIAFEAHPYTFKFLQKNVEENELGNVLPLNFAIGAEPGCVEIKYDPGNSGSTHVVSSRTEAAIEVPMICLDQALPKHGVNVVDYLKIDVEGYEGFVLHGARSVLERSKGILVQTEVNLQCLQRYDLSLNLMIDDLGDLGFSPHLVLHDGTLTAISPTELSYGDVIWSRDML
jgi:FkbM family methyltransferase